MTDATIAEMQRLLAGEFDAAGWEYDTAAGQAIARAALARGAVDSDRLSREVDATWLDRNGASRTEVAAAIERAIGGTTPVTSTPVALTIDNRTYQLNMAQGATISGSQVNVGGTQINVQATTGKADVLAGVGALVRAGLEGDWNEEALSDLAEMVSGRDDIGYEEVEAVVVEVAEEAKEHLDKRRIRRMMRSIAEQAISGALAIGLTSGLTEAIQLMPM